MSLSLHRSCNVPYREVNHERIFALLPSHRRQIEFYLIAQLAFEALDLRGRRASESKNLFIFFLNLI
jgi:hypothetical protein